jgi:pimeloyl-ACP methyl ester carboxylesterase
MTREAPAATNSHAEALTVSIPGFELSAECCGPADATKVLALHGWLDNCASFARLAPLLSRCRVVAIDLPGHGHSPHRLPGQAYHYADGVAVVFDVAKALGWSRFSLLGHSMGAGIAVLAAGACPDRVERLVLLDGLGPLTSRDNEAPSNLEKHLRVRNQATDQKVYPTLLDAEQRLMQAMPPLSHDAARCLAARGTRAVPGGFVWRADPQLFHPSPTRFNEAQVRAFLRRVETPTLVVRALGGPSVDAGVMGERLGCLPTARLLEVEGGHHVHLDHPELVAPAVEDWFAQ